MASSMELTSSSMEGTRPVSSLLCICSKAQVLREADFHSTLQASARALKTNVRAALSQQLPL